MRGKNTERHRHTETCMFLFWSPSAEMKVDLYLAEAAGSKTKSGPGSLCFLNNQSTGPRHFPSMLSLSTLALLWCVWTFTKYPWQEARDPNTSMNNLRSQTAQQNMTSVMKCDIHKIHIRSSAATGQILHQQWGGSWNNWRNTNTLIWEECALIPFNPAGANYCNMFFFFLYPYKIN